MSGDVAPPAEGTVHPAGSGGGSGAARKPRAAPRAGTPVDPPRAGSVAPSSNDVRYRTSPACPTVVAGWIVKARVPSGFRVSAPTNVSNAIVLEQS